MKNKTFYADMVAFVYWNLELLVLVVDCGFELYLFCCLIEAAALMDFLNGITNLPSTIVPHYYEAA
jgi:hypothetical protein